LDKLTTGVLGLVCAKKVIVFAAKIVVHIKGTPFPVVKPSTVK
jgi:hypothetical protein